jgi:hypothetical protein
MDHTTKSRCLNLSAAIVIRIVNAPLRAAMNVYAHRTMSRLRMRRKQKTPVVLGDRGF